MPSGSRQSVLNVLESTQESLANTDDTIDAKFRNSKDCCDFLSLIPGSPRAKGTDPPALHDCKNLT